jgi:hypothetical protein
MHTHLVERFQSGAEVPARAVAGLSREDLLAHPVPGTWSIQQIIVHLMDSEAVAVDRMKRIIAMERPLLIGYDESAFARSLFYEHQDLARVTEVFRLNRLLMTEILKRMDAGAWERWGVHNERGKLTLLEMVQGYCDHLEHHLKHLHRKRELLGKPLRQ